MQVLRLGAARLLALLVLSFPLMAAAQTPACGLVGTTVQYVDPLPLTLTTYECTAQPEQYTVRIYRVGLCTAEPVPTGAAAADFSSCSTVYDNPAGGTVVVQNGVSTPLAGGTVTRPPSRGYSFGYVLMEPQVQILNSKTFSGAMQAHYYAVGSGVLNSSGGTGTTCWTKAGTVYVWPAGGTVRNAFDCGPVPAAGTLNFTINSFDFATPQFTQTAIVNGSALSLYLVDGNTQLATATAGLIGTVSRLLGVQALAVTVSDASRGFDIGFQVSTGTMLGFDNPGPPGVFLMYGGPFSMRVSVR